MPTPPRMDYSLLFSKRIDDRMVTRRAAIWNVAREITVQHRFRNRVEAPYFYDKSVTFCSRFDSKMSDEKTRKQNQIGRYSGPPVDNASRRRPVRL